MTEQMNALQYLRSLSPNFITNHHIRTGWLVQYDDDSQAYAYELSEGDAPLGGTMYGVTVAQGPHLRHDLSDSFYDLGDAEAYIERLRAEILGNVH